MPSHNSNIINSFWMTFIKIIITKVNVMKICINKAHITAKKCNNIRIYNMNIYITIRKYILSSFSSTLFVRNLSGTNFNVIIWKSAALLYISWVFYLSRQYFSIKNFLEATLSQIFWVLKLKRNKIKYKKTNISSFITYFLSFITIRNKLYYRKIIINSFITHFLNFIAIRNKF